MKNKIIILLSLYCIGLVLSMVSCVDCGPFPNKFKIKSMDFSTVEFTFENNDLNWESDKDTIEYQQFGLLLRPKTETYFALNESSSMDWGLDFVNKAYACSPVIPITDERIDSIQVFTNVNFDENYSKDDNLSDLFDVIAFKEELSPEYERLDLKEYLDSKPFLDRDITLVLKSAPSESKALQFTVKYFQKGVDHDRFEFTSPELVILK